MSWYRTCPDCGANLDCGERCDCHDEKSAPRTIARGAGRSGGNDTESGKEKYMHLYYRESRRKCQCQTS